jgi:molybdopterin-guanine dinucleotide biosynthesis protein A
MGGGHKGLLAVDGVPMLTRVLAAVSPQVGAMLINSNADPLLFEAYGLPVLADNLPGYQGPLAGLLTGMQWARQCHPRARHLLSVPCDSPYLPCDLVTRLADALATGDSDIAIARDEDHRHPTLGLWPVALADRLAMDLDRHGVRGMQAWLNKFAMREVFFDAGDLRNINTPEDLAASHRRPPRNPNTSMESE